MCIFPTTVYEVRLLDALRFLGGDALLADSVENGPKLPKKGVENGLGAKPRRSTRMASHNVGIGVGRLSVFLLSIRVVIADVDFRDRLTQHSLKKRAESQT